MGLRRWSTLMPSLIRKPETPEQKRQHAIRRYTRQGKMDQVIFCPECQWPVLPADSGELRSHTTAEGKRCEPPQDDDESSYSGIAILNQDWRWRALCREYPPSLFDRTVGPSVAKAKAVCAQCPVIADCLAWVTQDIHYMGVAAGEVWHKDRSIDDEAA